MAEHRHDHVPDDEAALADVLDLDAEVLHDQLAEIVDWVADPPPGAVLDLGCGTGTGALALAGRFPHAAVTAVDSSAHLLDRLERRARELGVADRLRTVRADLDAGWPDVGPVDLVWASASLHHMADPDRVLADVLAALRPGGRLVVVELDGFPRFLPEDVGTGRPGLEARCGAALAERHTHDVPHLGADWGPRLVDAGFAVETERTVTVDRTAPLPAATGRYARAALSRLRSGLGDRLVDDDLAALDVLVGDGPDSVLRRGDLHLRATRSVWVARRSRADHVPL